MVSPAAQEKIKYIVAGNYDALLTEDNDKKNLRLKVIRDFWGLTDEETEFMYMVFEDYNKAVQQAKRAFEN